MKIAAVIVTFNRSKLLKQVLNIFGQMTVKPSKLIIVNNASTDDTKSILDDWLTSGHNIDVSIHHLELNVGGSGGFNFGLNEALKLDVDWVWVSDDDAFPEINIFEKFEIISEELSLDNVGAYCTSVINNGKIDFAHRRYLKDGIVKVEVDSTEEDYLRKYFKINLFSYVGAIISKQALLDVGVTEEGYFIWYDDTEHAMRINKKYNIYCIPNLTVIHDAIDNAGVINWKCFYGIRNKLISYKKHYPITYVYLVIRMMIGLFGLLIRGNIKEFRLKRKAIFSAITNTQGVDSNYRPGTKV